MRAEQNEPKLGGHSAGGGGDNGSRAAASGMFPNVPFSSLLHRYGTSGQNEATVGGEERSGGGVTESLDVPVADKTKPPSGAAREEERGHGYASMCDQEGAQRSRDRF